MLMDEKPIEEPKSREVIYKAPKELAKKRRKTFAFDNKLIEAAKKREVIYNPANKSNRYVELKEKAWIQIALELDVPVKKCKARWTSLRDRYRRITKNQEQAMENGTQIQNSWRYYNLLSFLSKNPVLNENYTEEDYTVLPEFEVETMFAIDQLQNMNCASVPTKRERLEESDPIKEFTTLKYREEPSKNAYEENDATAMFFMSLARRIKAANLPTLTQMKLEADILNFTVAQIDQTLNNETY